MPGVLQLLRIHDWEGVDTVNVQNTILPSLLQGTLLVFTLLYVSAHADPSADNLPMLRPIQDIHDELLSKFTPIDQSDGDVGINHSGDEPFTGDCDDYYTAAFNQLYRFGYTPFAQIVSVKTTGKRHIIACVESEGEAVCLDHNRKRTSSVRNLKRLYWLEERREVL